MTAGIAALRMATTELARAPSITVAGIDDLHQALLPEERHHGPRTVQNWIGGNDWHPIDADFVPPPAEHVPELMSRSPASPPNWPSCVPTGSNACTRVEASRHARTPRWPGSCSSCPMRHWSRHGRCNACSACPSPRPGTPRRSRPTSAFSPAGAWSGHHRLPRPGCLRPVDLHGTPAGQHPLGHQGIASGPADARSTRAGLKRGWGHSRFTGCEGRGRVTDARAAEEWGGGW